MVSILTCLTSFQIICQLGISLNFEQNLRSSTIELTEQKITYVNNEVICDEPSIMQSLLSMVNCTIIQGDLYLLPPYINDLSIFTPPQQPLPQFPYLREITGSLIIYSFHSPTFTSLAPIFPKLAVLGSHVASSGSGSFALVVMDTSLCSLELPSLRLIQHGNVWLQNNPELCHVYSVAWSQLLGDIQETPVIANNRALCADACQESCDVKIQGQTKRHCWSWKHCQTICDHVCIRQKLSCHMSQPKVCCHPECLAGCYGSGSDQCVTCRTIRHEGRCIKSCPTGYCEVNGDRCIPLEKCFPPSKGLQVAINNGQRNTFNWSVFDPKLCKHCTHREEKKHCGEVKIFNYHEIDKVRGCYSVKNLYINLRENRANTTNELSAAFSSLEEVTGSLRIVRSAPLVSLGFLRHLRVIRGQGGPNTGSNIVLKVFDNQNMRKIWDLDKRLPLVIERGTVSFSMNPRLCPEDIKNFMTRGVQPPINITQQLTNAIKSSNGNMAACNQSQLNLFVSNVRGFSVVLTWSNPPSIWNRQAEILIMLKTSDKNISLHEDRASCESDNWKTIEARPCNRAKQKCDHTIKSLLPATQYVAYIETKVNAVSQEEAISQPVYFRTREAKPDPPHYFKVIALNSYELLLNWKPPLVSRGVVSKYYIWYWSRTLNEKDFMREDICFVKTSWDGSELEEETNNSPTSTVNAKDVNFPDLESEDGPCSCDWCKAKCQQEEEDNFGNPVYDFLFHDNLMNHMFFRPGKRRIIKAPTDNGTLATTTEAVLSRNRREVEAGRKSIKTKKYHPPVKRIEVSSKKLQLLISNLDHYTEYVIQIQACHEPDNRTFAKIKKQLESNESNLNFYDDYNKGLCSHLVTVTKRTKAKALVDNVDSNLISWTFDEEGSSVRLEWSSPSQPNGIILYYIVRYRRSHKNDQWQSKCVSFSDWKAKLHNRTSTLSTNRKTPTNSTNSSARRGRSIPPDSQLATLVGGVTLEDLPGGEYVLQIVAVSLVGNGSWSDELTIYVPEPFTWIIALVIVALLIISIVLIGCIYWDRRRNQRDTRVSLNPVYCNIYERDHWEMNREDIDLLSWDYPLGKGSFGLVYRGALKKCRTPAARFYPEGVVDIDVAVKTMSASCTIYDQRDFINEACHMKRLHSPHLVRLLGIVSRAGESAKHNGKILTPSKFLKYVQIKLASVRGDGDLKDQDHWEDALFFRPLIVMELMEKGALSNYLRSLDDDGVLNERQALLWAAQVADGMAFLDHMKYVHRDLAARNCLIDSRLVVKIADFGLARDLCYSEYYRKEGSGRLPTRWMAPESLKNAIFTSASDVWSYGVLLWELATLSTLPYRGMSHMEVISYVIEGNTLTTNGFPAKCADLLGTIMMMCWEYHARKRPTFTKILSMLDPYTDQLFIDQSFYHSNQLSIENQGSGGSSSSSYVTQQGNIPIDLLTHIDTVETVT